MGFLLYLDEDIESGALLRSLRAAGLDVLSAGEAHMRGASDPEHLALCENHGRVLYTGNRGDFARLHAEFARSGRQHHGILVTNRSRYGVGEQLRRILIVQDALSQDDFVNRIEWLSYWGADDR